MRPPEHLPQPNLDSSTETSDPAKQRGISEMVGVRRTAWLCIALASFGVAYEFSLGLFQDSLPVWCTVGVAVVIATILGVVLRMRGNAKAGAAVLAAVAVPIGLVLFLVYAVVGASQTMAH
jgi:uncharacterized protein (DUF2062 family)